jgi:hypothetical protein
MLINSRNWALAFDTRDDSTQVLFADMIGVGPDHRASKAPFEFNKQLSAPYTLVGESLWSGFPFCRVTPLTNRIEAIDLPAPQPNERSRFSGAQSRRPTTRASFRVNELAQDQCEWIEPLADGEHVIAGNARALWLIPVRARASSSQPSSRPASQSSGGSRSQP